MSLTINLSEEVVRALEEQARRSGLSSEALAQRLLEKELTTSAAPSRLQRLDPHEWGRLLDEWLNRQDPNRTALSLESLRRESLYPDRA